MPVYPSTASRAVSAEIPRTGRLITTANSASCSTSPLPGGSITVSPGPATAEGALRKKSGSTGGPPRRAAIS